MVRIRLRRTGKKKQASFRVVVADSESPRDGRYIEIIGHYDPRTDPPTVVIQEDRALYWLSEGAQPSDPVARMLRKMGTLAKFEAMKRGEPVPETEAETEVEVEEELAQEAELEADQEPELDEEQEVEAEPQGGVEGEAETEAPA